jgi:dTDP-4-amino-4,6-dideoxygalactose transaminase
MGADISLKEFLEKYIPVTKPYMPDMEEFIPYLKKIWQTKWLTNNGEFHQQLEEELRNYLGVKYISLFSNGTLALMTALQELRITGEVITTPFSFVATTHSLWWNNIKPIFVDIEDVTFNLDASKIEPAITPETTAILPVHVYGNPCDIDTINKIAEKFGLKVIYDAAHCFGVEINNQSILNFGDLSVVSFHATKVFNTFEGGAIISNNEKTKQSIDYLKNFGFAGESHVIAPGINGKMNEIQAAFGLLQLKYVEQNIIKRKIIAETYRTELTNIDGLHLLYDIDKVKHNYAYFPVLIENNQSRVTRDILYDILKVNGIWSRKYFYPLISNLSLYCSLPSSNTDNLKTANKIANIVLCLPIYPDLKEDELGKIIDTIKKHMK